MRAIASIALTVVALGASGGLMHAEAAAAASLATDAVSEIAADGTRVVAAVSGTASACDRLLLWTPATAARSVFRAGTNCPNDGGIGGEGIDELALAGTRVAWVERLLGNFAYLSLYTRRPGTAKRTLIAEAVNASGAKGGVDGDYLGNVRGDGRMLVYNRWSVCTAYPPGYVVEPGPEPPCDTLSPPDVAEVTYAESVVRIGRKAAIATGPSALAIMATDAGRILVHRSGGDVLVLDRKGTVLQQLSFLAPTTFDAAALDGADLLLQHGTVLDRYDAGTGELLGTDELPTGARLTDVAAGFAVYLLAGAVHVVELATGQDVVFRSSRAVDAELEQDGLYYAWNRPSGSRRGRVVFVPLALLVPRFA